MRKGQKNYATTKRLVDDLTERLEAKFEVAEGWQWLNDINNHDVLRLHEAICDRLGPSSFLDLLKNVAGNVSISNCRRLREKIGELHPFGQQSEWVSAFKRLSAK